MQQLLALWRSFDMRRRAIVIGATLATFASMLALAGVASRPSMSLLYAGLDGAAAGQVLAALDQRGAVYDVRGDAIYVDATQRDPLRMSLASEGLPATGGAGYELLDSLSGFGTTSQMFDAAYWRAKEGELARTIASNPQIRAARVHIASPVPQGLRTASRPTASVTVTTVSGSLPRQQAKALKFLVASAVSGMAPADVAVIDSVGGLVQSAGDIGGTGQDDTRAAELRAGVERILEARVGPGHAEVELSIDTVTEREAVTERKFDPASRVAVSTDAEEKTNSATDAGSDAVTVASNLPTGSGSGAAGKSQTQGKESRERTNFEVSETTRELLRAPGAVRRLTVAVLVDGVTANDASGQPVWTPRPEEELAALKELVASAVGFDETRGDVITLKSLPFALPDQAGTTVTAGLAERLGLDPMKLIQLGVLAAVALVLGLFVLRPILSRPVAQLPRSLAAGLSAATRPMLTGEIDDGIVSIRSLSAEPARGPGAGRTAAIPSAAATDRSAADPVVRLRRLIDDRKDETVEILRGWIEDAGGERA